MSTYISAQTIQRLRGERGLTQLDLARRLGVTDKAVSKWETGRGLPDVALVEPLARELGVSVAELLTVDVRQNANRAGNMQRSLFYVCPICGNVVHALGEASISCCGSQLVAQEPQDVSADAAGSPVDAAHAFAVERVEDDWRVTLAHPMTKSHYVSFVAYVTAGAARIVKLYPEQDVEARFRREGSGWVYLYCNQHGLYRQRTPRVARDA